MYFRTESLIDCGSERRRSFIDIIILDTFNENRMILFSGVMSLSQIFLRNKINLKKRIYKNPPKFLEKRLFRNSTIF